MIERAIKRSNGGFVANKRILAVGVIAGLACGAAFLSEGTDLATAVSFITCVSLVGGAWVSYHGHALIIRIYSSWLGAIGKRLDLLRARLEELTPESANRTTNSRERRPIVAHIVKGSFALTPGALSAFATSSFMAVLWAQLPAPGMEMLLILLISCSVAVGVFVGGQCLYLAYLHWRVVFLGRQLERIAASVQVPEQALSPEMRRIAIFDGGTALSTRVWNLLGAESAAPTH